MHRFHVVNDLSQDNNKQRQNMEENSANLRICQEGHANALAMNNDSTQIAVAGRSLFKIYSVDGFTEVCNMRGGKNQNLSYSSNDVTWNRLDNNILATAATNGVVCIWDLTLPGRQKQKLTYQEHERTAHTVSFHNSDANILISGSQDGLIKCFDLRVATNAVHTFMSNSESIRDVKFSPHNSSVFSAVSENGSVQIWDIRYNKSDTKRSLQQFTAHSGPIYTCDWHPTQANRLATGSRDKQIKVWNIGAKPSLEYTIHTIAAVGRVKWRPGMKYHIASCALVVDYSVMIWDIRRPFIPYASFTEHTNVTTDIEFKGNEPNILFSTSKDSTIFKHSFKDAVYPYLKANPQATSLNGQGELLIAQRISDTEKFSPAHKTPDFVSQFYQTTSHLCQVKTDIEPKDTTDDALLWQFLHQLLDVSVNTAVKKEKVTPMSLNTVQTLPAIEYVEKKERFEERSPAQVMTRQIDEYRLSDIDLGDLDFVFGTNEINFENLSYVKKFRKGFLYIGNWQHEQLKETQLAANEERSLFQRENPQELLKVGVQAQASIWDPYETLRSFLFLQVEHGDVRTACKILRALQEKQFTVQIDEKVQECWLLSYIDLLHRQRQWNEAAYTIKMSTIPSVQEMSQQSTAVHLGCGKCNRMILNNPTYYCSKCRSNSGSVCAYCHLVVKGLYAYCITCSHGGHLAHMQEWFSNNSKCPVCGHLCEYE